MSDPDFKNVLLSFPKGDPGPAGPSGPRGPRGPSGADGSAFTPTRYTTAARPTADRSLAGRFIRVKDDGMPEKLQICLEPYDGVYEWVTIGITSS